jgi:hypothetical protein
VNRDPVMEHAHNDVASEIVAALRQLGYRDALLQEDYTFPDWFTATNQERQVTAAAFGQTPVSYESALIGVVSANGLREQGLVDACRALGAPILLEIDGATIREWAVSRVENAHALLDTYPADRLPQVIVQRATEWRPETLLRSKNLGSFRWSAQLNLFSGLLPELEKQIQEKLDPLLRDALSATRSTYVQSSGRQPSEQSLFKLVFWLLTAKVFADRGVPAFVSLGSNPDALLNAVARHYRTDSPRLLNREARLAATDRIWNRLDFRNLSVEVLAHIWSTTLVDAAYRRAQGIHRTPRTIVRYIVERIPFSPSGDDERIVFEPCAGSASFLIGAMNALRHNLPDAPPDARHKYFVKHLAGIENDPFGVEISKLTLTLADFPNPDGWKIAAGDVFKQGVMTGFLQRAGVVLCNPPFEDFKENQRPAYGVATPRKPAELLNRVLDDLHPAGVLGFVLPRNFVDGNGYARVRKRLAERFENLHLTVLPDRAFQADAEVVLLIATDPIPHDASRVVFTKVDDSAVDWAKFENEQAVTSEHSARFTFEDAKSRLLIPDLPEVWDALINHPILDDVAKVARGIEWNRALTRDGTETGERARLIRQNPEQGYEKGVAPQTTFSMFEVPPMAYLSMRSEYQRGSAWMAEWKKPKAILPKAAKSRGHWRIAAFPDHEGVVCYQTYTGVWPKTPNFDETLLAAVLNAPIANAFVATREGKTDITSDILKLVPVPIFSKHQRERIHSLVGQYQHHLQEPLFNGDELDHILKQIDAAVLDAYTLPPRVERKLLDFFRGHARPVRHQFSEYIPADCEVFFSLSEFLSPEFADATAGALLRRSDC